MTRVSVDLPAGEITVAVEGRTRKGDSDVGESAQVADDIELTAFWLDGAKRVDLLVGEPKAARAERAAICARLRGLCDLANARNELGQTVQPISDQEIEATADALLDTGFRLPAAWRAHILSNLQAALDADDLAEALLSAEGEG